MTCHLFPSHVREEIQALTKKFQDLDTVKKEEEGGRTELTPEVQFL